MCVFTLFTQIIIIIIIIIIKIKKYIYIYIRLLVDNVAEYTDCIATWHIPSQFTEEMS